MFSGILTAMITPFLGEQVDHDQLDRQIAYQIDAGVDGLVPVGTTGESPTLSHSEHRQVVERVCAQAAGRVKVVAGTGSNATSEAVALTRHAKTVGADGALVVNPYYNKPTQEGLYRHFMSVADVGLPVVLYNIPGRTAVALTAETIGRLAEHDNIVAVKEATGSMDMASEVAAACDLSQFSLLSGDDSLTLPLMALGGKGVISVLSNLLPQRVKALADAAASGNFAEAARLHHRLFPLFKAMFLETNPIPVKAAMAMVGRDSGQLRLPMCEISADNKRLLAAALEAGGVAQGALSR